MIPGQAPGLPLRRTVFFLRSDRVPPGQDEGQTRSQSYFLRSSPAPGDEPWSVGLGSWCQGLAPPPRSLPGQEVDRGWPCPLACCPQGRAFQCSRSPWLRPKIAASFIHREQGLPQDLPSQKSHGGLEAPPHPPHPRLLSQPAGPPLHCRPRSPGGTAASASRCPLGTRCARASGQSAPAAACGAGRRVRVRRCGGRGAAPRTLRARSLSPPFASVSARGYWRPGCLRMAGEVEKQKQKQGRASQAPSQVARDRPLPRAHVGASGAGSTEHSSGRTGRQADASRRGRARAGLFPQGPQGGLSRV